MQQGARVLGQGGEVGFGAAAQAEGAHEDVEPDGGGAGDFRERAGAEAAHGVHLEGAVTCVQPAERHGGVMLRCGVDAGDAVSVEQELDRGGEAGEAQAGVAARQREEDGRRDGDAGEQGEARE